MNIELVELDGQDTEADREIWLKVQSDEVIDLPSALEALNPDQAAVMKDFVVYDTNHPRQATPLRYWAPNPYDYEDTHRFEDWWAFGEKSTAKNNRLRENA